VFFSLVAKDDDKPGSQLVIILGFFSLAAEDDNKPLDSLSSFTFFFSCIKQRQAIVISWFYSLLTDDNDMLGSQLVVVLGFFFFSCRK